MYNSVIKTTLLFIDGLNAVRREFGESFHRAVRDVIFQMKKNKITVVLGLLGGLEKETLLSTIVDNIVELNVVRVNGRLKREIAVRKARMCRISNEVREFVLDGKLAVRG